MLDPSLVRTWLPAVTVLLAVGMVSPLSAQETDDARRERDRGPRVTINGRGSLNANRGRLGVSIAGSTDDRDYAGALVTDVTRDGPADEAGIREGDVITAIDGHRLVEPLPDRPDERELDLDRSVPVQRLMALLRDVEPRDEVQVTYERDGVETTATVVADDLSRHLVLRGLGSGTWRMGPTVFDYDDWEEMRLDADEMRIHVAPRIEALRDMGGAWGFSGFGASGLEMVALNPELGSYFGAEEGVLILDIDEDSTLGLEPGDVLQNIDGRSVRDRDHARRILGSYEPGEAVSFGVIRRGAHETVEGYMPERHRRRRGGLRN